MSPSHVRFADKTQSLAKSFAVGLCWVTMQKIAILLKRSKHSQASPRIADRVRKHRMSGKAEN
jgi:hypothetical protein